MTEVGPNETMVTSYDTPAPDRTSEPPASSDHSHAADNTAALRLAQAGVLSEDRETARGELHGLARTFPEFESIRGLYGRYENTLDSLREQTDWTDDERKDGAATLREEAEKSFSELAEKLQEAIDTKAEQASRFLFSAPGTTVPGREKAESQRGYREALMSLADADEGKLASTLEMAELTNDEALARAVFTAAVKNNTGGRSVAEIRGAGPTSGVIADYLASRPRAAEKFAEAAALPDAEQLSAILSYYRPQPPRAARISPPQESVEAARRQQDMDQRRRRGAVR